MSEPAKQTARDFAGNGAQLVGLWALAVVQPFFEVTKPGEVFVAMGWRGGDIVLFALCLAFAPPAVMVAAEVLVGKVRPALGRALHVAFVGIVVAILALYGVKHETELRSEAALAIGAAIGGGAAYLFNRFSPIRSFVSLLAPASVLSVGLFLFASPVNHLVFSAEGSELSGPTPAASTVFVVFDEFPTLSLLDRRGALDERRYPAFAQLARDGIWFRNATTVADGTAAGTSAILTGRHQDGRTPASVSAHPDNLLALLGRRGGATVQESSHTHLCPSDVCTRPRIGSFPGRIARVLPALGKLSLVTFLPDGVYRRLPATRALFPHTDPAEAFERLQASFRKPVALHYVHPHFPHGPWSWLPSGKRYLDRTPTTDFLPNAPAVPADSLPVLRWTGDLNRVVHVRQRHLAQVQAADKLLGETLERLRERGLYDSALIVVTADHGIAFQPNVDVRRLRRENAARILPVPLFLKLPGERRGVTSERFVQSIDIAPTVADALGFPLPWKPDGRSALDTTTADRTRLAADAYEGHERFEFDPRSLVRELRAAAAEQGRHFAGSGPGRLFRIGPHGTLVGRPVAEMRRGPRSELKYAPDRLELEVEPDSEYLPALISGRVEGRDASGQDLVIAVNGKVAASTITHPSGSQVRFEALVAENFFRPGINRLAVYAVSADESGPVLSEVVPLAEAE